MSTVDDAAMAAAWELAKGDQTWAVRLLTRLMMAETPDLFAHNTDQARTAIVAAWPILSAPLRELHTRWDQGGGWVVCTHCIDNTSLPRKTRWPCETITELDRIDRELGIETDNQSGDPS